MLDIESNRKVSKYQIREQVLRVLWGVASVVFKLIPRPFFGVRRSILRIFGAKIGIQVHIYSSATIYFPWNLEIGDFSAIGENCLIYNLGKVTIGQRTTISHRAHLCAGSHDYTDPTLPLLKLPISIGNQAWICSDAFIGPGVTVGEGAIVGARGVAMSNVSDWTIVAGNPARWIKKRLLMEREYDNS